MVEVQQMFTSDPESVRELRTLIGDQLHQFWSQAADETAICQLQLAVSEAATNIILHGYQREPGRQIEMILKIDDEFADVLLRHSGCDFQAEQVPLPNFDGRAESGYGLYLIRKSVDELQYSRHHDGRCQIHLLKKRHS